MNQKPVGARAEAMRRSLEESLAQLGKPSPEDIEAWQRIRAELSESRREAKLPI
jgi:hypothetical protein